MSHKRGLLRDFRGSSQSSALLTDAYSYGSGSAPVWLASGPPGGREAANRSVGPSGRWTLTWFRRCARRVGPGARSPKPSGYPVGPTRVPSARWGKTLAVESAPSRPGSGGWGTTEKVLRRGRVGNLPAQFLRQARSEQPIFRRADFMTVPRSRPGRREARPVARTSRPH